MGAKNNDAIIGRAFAACGKNKAASEAIQAQLIAFW